MDIFSASQRSALMSRIRSSKNASTEAQLARLLRLHRITGWRRNEKLTGRPDFVFRGSKVAIFVDGCFWHCCPMHGRSPASNTSYWLPKLARNKRRDYRVARQLRALGWMVIRIWEHDLPRPKRILPRIRSAIQKRSAASGAKGAPSFANEWTN